MLDVACWAGKLSTLRLSSESLRMSGKDCDEGLSDAIQSSGPGLPFGGSCLLSGSANHIDSN